MLEIPRLMVWMAVNGIQFGSGLRSLPVSSETVMLVLPVLPLVSYAAANYLASTQVAQNLSVLSLYCWSSPL